MVFLLPLVVFAGIFFLVSRAMSGAGRGLGGGRVLARGLVLSASPYSSGERTQYGQRFELRDLVLDVEIPGKEPYEVSVRPLIPRICEGRPGSALDLAVHPRRPNDIMILGPAGSHAWLAAAPQLSMGTTGAKASRFVVATALAIFPALMALGFAAARSKDTSHTTSATSTHSAATHALSSVCDSAAKCCRVVGGSSCTQFAGMDNLACTKALQSEQVAASKAHKRCP